MLGDRERRFLDVLALLGGAAPVRVFYGWLRVACSGASPRARDGYRFVDLGRGPVSFAALEDARSLRRRGYLAPGDHVVRLGARALEEGWSSGEALALGSPVAFAARLAKLFPPRRERPDAERRTSIVVADAPSSLDELVRSIVARGADVVLDVRGPRGAVRGLGGACAALGLSYLRVSPRATARARAALSARGAARLVIVGADLEQARGAARAYGLDAEEEAAR